MSGTGRRRVVWVGRHASSEHRPRAERALLSPRLVGLSRRISKRKDVSVGMARMTNLRLGSGSVDVFEGVSAAPPRTQESTRRSC